MLTDKRQAKIQQVVAQRQCGVIVLEDIHDPHNAQAVMRTCDCFGFQNIYFVFKEEKRFNPKRIGKLSSSSANKWTDHKFFTSIEDCYQELHKEGYSIFTTVLDEKAESIYQANFCIDKLAIVFGNENRGVSAEAIQGADHLLTIPMSGMVQSLNLSVTAAISLFEITRQRQAHGIEKFALDQAEQEMLIENFTQR